MKGKRLRLALSGSPFRELEGREADEGVRMKE